MVVYCDRWNLMAIAGSCLVVVALQQARIVLLKRMIRRRDRLLKELTLDRAAKTSAGEGVPRPPEDDSRVAP